ncbi:putative collagen-binding domain-containing protein, partial [Candidatus Poribacteria bacterium]
IRQYQMGKLFDHQSLAALLTAHKWWKLEPRREWLEINGLPNPLPTSSDLTPPHCAAICGELYIVYIPRGNSDNTIVVTNLNDMDYSARWVDPRSGNEISIKNAPSSVQKWTIPDLPQPSVEDWVLVLDAN